MQLLPGLILLFVYYSCLCVIGRVTSSVTKALLSRQPAVRQLLLDTLAALITACNTANYSLLYQLGSDLHPAAGGEVLIGVGFFVGALVLSVGLPTADCSVLNLVTRWRRGDVTLGGLLLTVTCQVTCVVTYIRSAIPLFHELGVLPADVHKPLHVCSSVVAAGRLKGSAIEALGGALSALSEVYMFVENSSHDNLLKNLGFSVISVYFLNETGFYINPTNALCYRLPCRGETTFNLVLVYLVAPLAAYVITHVILEQTTAWRKTREINSNIYKNGSYVTSYNGITHVPRDVTSYNAANQKPHHKTE